MVSPLITKKLFDNLFLIFFKPPPVPNGFFSIIHSILMKLTVLLWYLSNNCLPLKPAKMIIFLKWYFDTLLNNKSKKFYGPIFARGLGLLFVRSLILVPFPPASITRSKYFTSWKYNSLIHCSKYDLKLNDKIEQLTSCQNQL